MFILRVLKRKDAFSVIVAIAVGLSLAQLISSVGINLSRLLTGVLSGATPIDAPRFDWQTGILDPIVLFLLHIVALEVALQAIIRLNGLLDKAITHQKKK